VLRTSASMSFEFQVGMNGPAANNLNPRIEATADYLGVSGLDKITRVLRIRRQILRM
jgi:hypothetical protein